MTTSHTRALATALRTLVPILTPEQVKFVVGDRIVNDNIRNLPDALTFNEALSAPEHVRAAIDAILRGLRTQTGQDRLNPLIASLRSLSRHATPEHVNIVLEETLNRLGTTTNPNQLSATVSALQVFVPRLAPGQVALMLHGIVDNTSTSSEQTSSHMTVLGVIAPRLTPDQLLLAFRYVLDRSRTAAEQSRVAGSVLEALGDALKEFASKLTREQLQATLGTLIKILSNSADNVELARFIRTLEEFVPSLSGEQIAMLASIAQARLAFAVGSDEGAAWARLVNVELRRRPEHQHLREVVKVLKFPTSAGEPTAVLLSGIRDRFDSFPREGSLWEMVAWIKLQRRNSRAGFYEAEDELRREPVNPIARGAVARGAH